VHWAGFGEDPHQDHPPLETHDGMPDTAIPPNEFAKYAGSYRNGDNITKIEERDGKLSIGPQELRKGVGDWLVTKTGQVFYAGGRAAVRVP